MNTRVLGIIFIGIAVGVIAHKYGLIERFADDVDPKDAAQPIPAQPIPAQPAAAAGGDATNMNTGIDSILDSCDSKERSGSCNEQPGCFWNNETCKDITECENAQTDDKCLKQTPLSCEWDKNAGYMGYCNPTGIPSPCVMYFDEGSCPKDERCHWDPNKNMGNGKCLLGATKTPIDGAFLKVSRTIDITPETLGKCKNECDNNSESCDGYAIINNKKCKILKNVSYEVSSSNDLNMYGHLYNMKFKHEKYVTNVQGCKAACGENCAGYAMINFVDEAGADKVRCTIYDRGGAMVDGSGQDNTKNSK